MKLPRRHYRLDFIAENSLTRLWSIRFTRTRVILASAIAAAALVALMFVILRFTPAGKIMPGWTAPDTKARMVEMALKLDSLERIIQSQQQYSANLISILKGDAVAVRDSLPPAPTQLTPEQADSLLAPTPAERAYRSTMSASKH